MSFDSLRHVRVLIHEPSIDEAIAVLESTSDDVLMEKDKTSGATLLFYAAQRKNDREALALSQYLAEKRQVCIPNVVDVNGQTALFFAARDGNVETARYLISKGCDPQLLDSAGQSALFYACRDGRTNIVKVLIEEYNVEINQQDKVGQTGLFYAAREGQLGTAKYMLKMGADPSLRDWQKKTAAAYAQKYGHYELAAHLKSDVRNVKKRSLGKHHESPPLESRQKYILQFQADIEDNEIWLYATEDKLQEFSSSFPDIAIWDPGALPPSVNITDAFRDEWCREALAVVDVVSKFQDGWLFMRPVNTKAWNCPDYYSIIKEPRDFSMIKRNLRAGAYASVHTFVRDMELVFLNCFRYNSENTEVHSAGKRVQAFCRSVFEEKNIAKWIQKEDALVEYLKAHNLPVSIGLEAVSVAPQESGVPPITSDNPIIESEDSRT